GIAVGPAPLERLDEPLRLAVGSRRVRPREALPNAVPLACGGEELRLVALGVVREDPLAVDSTFLEPAYGALEKCSGARCVLRGEHLGIRQARVVVDADEDDFPTNTPSLAAPISMDRMPDPLDPS